MRVGSRAGLETLFVEHVSNLAVVDFDRRAKPRIKESFPARMRAAAADGQEVSGICVVDNMSATGLYARCQHAMSLGAELEVTVQLFVEGETGSTVETTGKVVRVERLRDGSHGVAMVIRRHKFL